jgi:hypothetical protein
LPKPIAYLVVGKRDDNDAAVHQLQEQLQCDPCRLATDSIECLNNQIGTGFNLALSDRLQKSSQRPVFDVRPSECGHSKVTQPFDELESVVGDVLIGGLKLSPVTVAL